ncbi:hypothetical protein [Riemerella anatipestifer]|uniref:hypothetical protein n=1 Tax=Riemerella anatipestifer TaxID=34085 RepID=UPI00129DF624|nr:hypothetical protein [Riemerella anatipestifer]
MVLRYDSLHSKNLSGRSQLERLRVLSKKNEVAPTAVEAEAYIDFNIRSQTIVEKNGDRWVVFPRIKGGKVAELVAGVLSEDETKVHFYSLKPDTDIYKTNAHLFEEKYRDRYVFKVNKHNLFELLPMGICNKKRSYYDDCMIDEVMITRPEPSIATGGGIGSVGSGWFWTGNGSGWVSDGEGGDCSRYGMCIYNDGGGGYTRSNPPTDPCEKAKTQITNNTEAQKAVDNLREHIKSGVGGEKGWLFPSEGGAAKPTTENHNHRVNLGPLNEIKGAYHNHTGSGVDIFSAVDVASLIEIARYRGIGNREDAFMGMVAPGDIHYLIRFTGKKNELPAYGSYSPEMLKELNEFQWDFYVKTFSKSNLTKEQRLEQTLFKTLEKMGLKDRVTLQRVDKNNNVSTISQNQNGTINVTPC